MTSLIFHSQAAHPDFEALKAAVLALSRELVESKLASRVRVIGAPLSEHGDEDSGVVIEVEAHDDWTIDVTSLGAQHGLLCAVYI